MQLQADPSDGVWTYAGGRRRAWLVRVASRCAKSLAIAFARFALPEGGELCVHHEDRAQILGACAGSNRHDDGGLVFEPFGGESLVLELDPPPRAAAPNLRCASVIHDDRDVLGPMDGCVRVDAWVPIREAEGWT